MLSIASPLFMNSSGTLEKAVIVGVVAITIGLLVVSSYGGTLIDFKGKKVKEYTSFMGYKFGQWSALPVITRVVVISGTSKVSNTPNGISPTWSGEETNYKVLLYTDTSSAVHSFLFSNKDRAISDGRHLAANLNAAFELR